MNLKFSFRNIFKNRRRSIITIIAIAIGFSSLNLMGGYIQSIYTGLMEQSIIGERLGHLTIVKSGYFSKGKLYPEKYMLSESELSKVTSLLSEIEDIKLISPRMDLSGLVTNGNVSTIFISEGIKPEDMIEIRGKYADLPGMLDANNPDGGAFSEELASLLGLKEGDDAVMMLTTIDGGINALDIQVSSIYNTGNVGTNDKFVLLPFSFAQKIYEYNGASRLIVLLQDIGMIPVVRAEILEKLHSAGMDVEVKTWKEMSSFYNQVKMMFDMIFMFIFIIVLLIVVMSILNTMGMSVVERTREIGTMRSLGMRRFGVLSVFSIEGMLLAAIGCAIGVAVTYLISQIVYLLEIHYIPPNSSDPILLNIELRNSEIILTYVFMIALGFIASILPAYKASKLKIIDALGHV